MNKRRWIQMILLPFAIAALSTVALAQGKGKGQGSEKEGQGQARGERKPEKAKTAPAEKGPTMSQQRGKPDNPGQARVAEKRAEGGNPGRGVAAGKDKDSFKDLPVSANAAPRAGAPNRGREISRFAKDLKQSDVRPSVQRFVVSTHPAQFVTGGALAYALARGIPDNTLVITPSGNDVWIRNRRGDALLMLDDDRARNLGAWQVSPLVDPVKEGAPSFCRSGAGHPVWGRQWCLEKGFGLGTSPDYEWAAARDIGDLVYVRPATTGSITRDALLNLLGPVVFNRLALHALTLGYADPLTGFWRSDATGPTLLQVNSGRYPVAEFVDGNRDQRPDLMLVALRPW